MSEMSMNRCVIFIVGDPSRSVDVQKKFSCQGHCRLEVGNEAQLFQDFAALQPVAIAYDSENLTEADLQSIKKISKAFTSTQVLVVVKDITIPNYQLMTKLKNVVVISRDSTTNQIEMLMSKISNRLGLQTMPEVRFTTDQEVQLVVMRTGHFIPTRMKNYSAHGAFLEYRGVAVKVGDLLQIGLQHTKNPQFKRLGNQIKAKVVWIRDEGPKAEIRGLGVQFLDGMI